MKPNTWRAEHGVTLVETLITMMIIALLATMSAPVYGDLVARHRLDNAAVQVMADLMLARKEALSRQHTVQLIFDSPQHYRVWRDLNDNNRMNRGEVEPRAIDRFDAKMKADAHPRFWPSGKVTESATIKLRHPGVSNQQARCITIGLSGHVQPHRCRY